MSAPLNAKLNSVKWGEFRLGDLFDIKHTMSLNTESLIKGDEYDYVTRTSLNQGILQTTGFINERCVNESGTWSLGLLQMDFFYRNKPWYAGQFVRKIVPKIVIPKDCITFITAVLNRIKDVLLKVLVRYVDETFCNMKIRLPEKQGIPDFTFMESFIRELEEECIRELSAYLKASGLDNTNLTIEEQNALRILNTMSWSEYNVPNVFEVKNTRNIDSSSITENSGTTPYLCASALNNGVGSYISYNESMIDKGNCIFIGGKTFVVSYQEKDFFSNDSHNLALYCKDIPRTKLNQLFLATCVNKSLGHKYTWGDSISKTKIKKDKILLPSTDSCIDFSMMETLITAIQKLVIKDVVKYVNKKLEYHGENYNSFSI